MARKGQNLYRRKDGRWEGRYIAGRRGDGSPKYGYIYARTMRDAKEKLRAKYVEIAQKQAEPAPVPGTFAEAARRWLDVSQANFKESTRDKYIYLLEKQILPCLGELPISMITRETVEIFAMEKQKNGRLDGRGGLAAKTVADMVSVIKLALRHAKAAVPDVKIRCAAPKMPVLSGFQQSQLTAAMKGDSADLCKLGVLLALHTGVREGELCALRWQDIDLREKILHIRGTLQRVSDHSGGAAKTKVIITGPKSTSSAREIPLPAWLAKKLHAVYNANPQTFFLTGSSNNFVEPRSLRYKFQSYLKSAGISHVNFHALRHTFATRAVENGFELKSLSEILGHSNVNITLNRYVHSSMDLKRQQMERLAAAA